MPLPFGVKLLGVDANAALLQRLKGRYSHPKTTNPSYPPEGCGNIPLGARPEIVDWLPAPRCIFFTRPNMAMRFRYASLAEEVIDVKRKREWLLQSLRAHVIPALVQQGFTSVVEILHGPIDREYKMTFPFDPFIRRRGDSIDFVEIQLAPYRADYFRMNAGVSSSQALGIKNGHSVFDSTNAQWSRRFEMLARPKLWWFCSWSWFTARTWPRQPAPADYDRLATRVAGYLPELQLAFEQDHLGPHLRRSWIPLSVAIN